MKIVRVQTKVVEGFIPLPDFNAVKRALRQIESTMPAENLQALRPKAGPFNGGLGRIVRTALADWELGSSSLERKLKDMQVAFGKRGVIMQELDYNGSADLDDAKIQVYKTLDPAAPFALHLAGPHCFETPPEFDATEDQIAENLGIERGLWKIMGRVVIARSGTKFEFDCDEIAARLRRAGLSGLTASQIVSSIKKGEWIDYFCHGAGKVALPWPGVAADFAIDEHTVGTFWRHGSGSDEPNWQYDGNVISGDLLREAVPAFVITINPPVRETEYRGHLPIFRPEVKSRMRAASRMIEAFK